CSTAPGALGRIDWQPERSRGVPLRKLKGKVTDSFRLRCAPLRMTCALLLSVFVRHYPPPQTLRSPDASAQAFQLHDLAVIDKEIYICSVVFDVPRQYIRICCFNH